MLTPQQVLDTADVYFYKNSFDTALVLYHTLIAKNLKTKEVELQKRVVEAFNRAAIVYYHVSNYSSAYDFFIKALQLSEEIGYLSYQPKIYTNIGNIYHRYKKYEIAKSYYLKALTLSLDSITQLVIFNNLASVEIENGKLDSAYCYLEQALHLSKQHDDINLCNILNNFASFYRIEKNYNLASHYYQLSLDEARGNHDREMEANNLSFLGQLFFQNKKTDSALFYINISNTVATESNLLNILADNYLLLSQIEEAKGNVAGTLAYFRKHAALKDSVLNVEKYADIHQLQRLYEVSKTNQQIEELYFEKQVNEHTIHYQKIILRIILVALVLLSGLLLFVFIVFFQNKKLRKSYKMLFYKNIEIIKLENKPSEKDTKTNKKQITDIMIEKELMDKVLTIMEDVSIICNPEFTIEHLAMLVNSKHYYVSQLINTALEKNFRSFLNTYRIREAQRIFADTDLSQYTIEYVSTQVGFKSRSAFREAFKEITGVSPSFYIKSLQESNRDE